MDAVIKEEAIVEWGVFPDLKFECKREPVADLVPVLPGYLKTEPQDHVADLVPTVPGCLRTEPQVKTEAGSPGTAEAHDATRLEADPAHRAGSVLRTLLFGAGAVSGRKSPLPPTPAAVNGSSFLSPHVQWKTDGLDCPNAASATLPVPALPTKTEAVEEIILIDSDDEDATHGNDNSLQTQGVGVSTAKPRGGGDIPAASASVKFPGAVRDFGDPCDAFEDNSMDTYSTDGRTSCPATAEKSVHEVVLIESDDEDTPRAVGDNSGKGNSLLTRGVGVATAEPRGACDIPGTSRHSGAEACVLFPEGGDSSTDVSMEDSRDALQGGMMQVSAATPRAVPVSGGVPTAPRAQPTPRAASTKSSDVTNRNLPEGRPGRGRTVFSPEQLERLDSEYVSGRHKSRERRSELARELGLPESCIQFWFQNRCAEDREDADRRHSSRDGVSKSTSTLTSQVHSPSWQGNSLLTRGVGVATAEPRGASDIPATSRNSEGEASVPFPDGGDSSTDVTMEDSRDALQDNTMQDNSLETRAVRAAATEPCGGVLGSEDGIPLTVRYFQDFDSLPYNSKEVSPGKLRENEKTTVSDITPASVQNTDSEPRCLGPFYIPTKCPVCSEEIRDEDRAKRHLCFIRSLVVYRFSERARLSKLKCGLCDKPEYNCPRAYTKHVLRHFVNLYFSCSICGKKFTDRHTFTVHSYTHTGQWQYKCRVCGLGCASQSHLDNHEEIHSEENLAVCEICGDSFKTRRRLAIHLEHHEGKFYTCTICNKVSKTSKAFKSHMERHKTLEEQKKYNCDLCENVYRTSTGLRIHKDTHHFHKKKEKKYSCSICSKSFNIRANLENHMVFHTGEKRFTCDICKKKFFTKTSLARHISEHSGDKNFSCDICGMKFTQRSSVKRHKGTAHS